MRISRLIVATLALCLVSKTSGNTESHTLRRSKGFRSIQEPRASQGPRASQHRALQADSCSHIFNTDGGSLTIETATPPNNAWGCVHINALMNLNLSNINFDDIFTGISDIEGQRNAFRTALSPADQATYGEHIDMIVQFNYNADSSTSTSNFSNTTNTTAINGTNSTKSNFPNMTTNTTDPSNDDWNINGTGVPTPFPSLGTDGANESVVPAPAPTNGTSVATPSPSPSTDGANESVVPFPTPTSTDDDSVSDGSSKQPTQQPTLLTNGSDIPASQTTPESAPLTDGGGSASADDEGWATAGKIFLGAIVASCFSMAYVAIKKVTANRTRAMTTDPDGSDLGRMARVELGDISVIIGDEEQDARRNNMELVTLAKIKQQRKEDDKQLQQAQKAATTIQTLARKNIAKTKLQEAQKASTLIQTKAATTIQTLARKNIAKTKFQKQLAATTMKQAETQHTSSKVASAKPVKIDVSQLDRLARRQIKRSEYPFEPQQPTLKQQDESSKIEIM